MASLLLEDFRYGLNIVDNEADSPPNGTYAQQNCSVDEFGLLGKRGGCASLITFSGTPVYVFYSRTLDKYFVQEGTTLKKYSNAFAFEANVFTLPTTDKIAMVDFNSTSGAKCVFVHKTGGVYDSPDGTTWTNRSATVKGTTIAVWHNKLFIGGDTSNPARLWWSNAGTSATYTTTTDFNDLREKDVGILTCLHETAGILLAFKENSAYRINNPATGEYDMIDRLHGASEHESVASIAGIIGCGSTMGFYTTDGNSALIERSHPVAPYFQFSGPGIIVTTLRDRFYVSTQGEVTILEWDPKAGLALGGGWWSHWPSNGGSGHAMYSCAGQQGDRLIVLDGFQKRLYSFADRSLAGDFGTDIPFDYTLAWQRLGATDKVRVRRMIVEGRGPIDVYLKRNYSFAEDAVRSIVLSSSPTGTRVATAELRSLGVCRAFGARFYSTYSASFQRLIGSVGIYDPCIVIARIRLDYIPLGRA